MLGKDLMAASLQSQSKISIVQELYIDIPVRDTDYALPNDADIDWTKTSFTFVPYSNNSVIRGSGPESIPYLDAYFLSTSTGSNDIFYMSLDRDSNTSIDRGYVQMTINAGTGNKVRVYGDGLYTCQGTLIVREYDFNATIYHSALTSGTYTASWTTPIDDIQNVYLYLGLRQGKTGNTGFQSYSGALGLYKFPQNIEYNTPLTASSDYHLYIGSTANTGGIYYCQYKLVSPTSISYKNDSSSSYGPYTTVFSLN